jgi:hypothetical protein
MTDIRETNIEWIAGEKIGVLSSAEPKYIKLMHDLKEKFPKEVDIAHTNPDGSVFVKLPVKWIKIAPPAKRNLSSEERQKRRDRINAFRNTKNQ